MPAAVRKVGESVADVQAPEEMADRATRHRAARAAAPIGFPELVFLLGRVGHDFGDLPKHVSGATIAVRIESAEFIHRVARIESHEARIRANPTTRVQALGPSRQVVALEGVETFTLHADCRADVFEPQPFAPTVKTKPKRENVLGGHPATGR